MEYVFEYQTTCQDAYFRVIRVTDRKATAWLPNEEAYDEDGRQYSAEEIFARNGLAEFPCREEEE